MASTENSEGNKTMNPLFCDCCGDQVKMVYPCKFIFHDGLTRDFNICLDCMETGTLEINLPRQRLVTKILSRMGKVSWKKRLGFG